jgi:alpha-tubulin suppressor-like RCC1 family protein
MGSKGRVSRWVMGESGRGRMRRSRSAVAALLAFGSMLVAATAAHAVIEKPVNTGLPTIAGQPKEGSLFKAKEGKWTGGSISFKYQWQRCNPECEDIATATSSEYTARFVDVGAELQIVVTAENTAGSTTATSARTGEIVQLAPKVLSAPVVSGELEEGQLLSVSPGGWGGSPATYQYQWERCTTEKCTNITGATESSYRLESADIGDKMRATVKATNAVGSKNSTSSQTATTVGYGPPVAVDLPTLSGGARLGRTLTATTGDWGGIPPIEYTYSWQRCSSAESCTTISGATASTYTLAAGDVGKHVRVSVTASDSHGSRTSHSVATAPVLGESDDFVLGWGEDFRGQLGTIYRTPWEASPVVDEGRSGVTALAAGGSFTLELHSDGTVTASGASSNGSLGYGGRKATWEQGTTQVAVKGLTEVKAISAGVEYGMALLENGTVKAWGANGYGQLGNGKGGTEIETGENRLEPKEVLALSGKGIVGIASGAGANYAVRSNGEVLAWGHNKGGQLGVAWPEACEKLSTCETSAKKPLEEPEKKEPEHKCVVENRWELCGKLPAPVLDAEAHPIKEVIEVSAGLESAYALNEKGEVLSWGNDQKAQLGQALEPEAHTAFTPAGPVLSSPGHPLKGATQIAAGNNYGLALLENGEVVGWGDDSEGALAKAAGTCVHGSKTWPCNRYAAPIGGLEGVKVVSIDAGSNYSTALGENGEVYTVGSNAQGQLGRGPGCEEGGGVMGANETCFSSKWQAVPGVEHVQRVSAGLTSAIALLGSGAAPSPPVVGVEAESKALRLEWVLPSEEASEEVVYRKWESPGEEPAEEEGEGGGTEGEGETEEPVEEGTGTAPKNTTRPQVRVFEIVEGERKHVSTEAAVGQILVVTSPGNWTATPAVASYEYKWLRCKGGHCTAIEGASGPEYVMSEADAAHTIEVQVTARNGVKPAGVETSEPTETVKAEDEGRSAKALKVKLTGQDGLLVGAPPTAPLEHVQYEVKLVSESEVVKGGRKTRLMVLTPLP